MNDQKSANKEPMSYKKVTVTEFGEPNVLRIETEHKLPEPVSGEVRIKVEASSALSVDTEIRKGIYPLLDKKPPFTLGYDFVGTVDKLGEGVTELKVGQRVAGITQIGGNAEYICRPANGLVSVPNSVESAEAACLVLSWMTAYQMLRHAAEVERGDKILVHGGSGAVGTALLQLGRHMDLNMVATSSKKKLDLLRTYGATAIDYRAPNCNEQLQHVAADGFDAAFDAVGLSSFRHSYRLLKNDGVLITYGTFNLTKSITKSTFLKDVAFGLNFAALKVMLLGLNALPNRKRAKFFSIVSNLNEHSHQFVKDLDALFDLLAAGHIKPIVDERLSLEDAVHAHEMIDKGQVRGQLVFLMEASSR